MESFADESVNEISCMCSAQSAKTLTMLALLAWAIAEDPGPILWVTSSIKEAKKFVKGRLMPLLEHCAPVSAKFPKKRELKNLLEIYFPGATLVITGSESESSLQSTPYRYLFLDEARSYPKGALAMVSERTTSYTHNYKRVQISTPDMEQDGVHHGFLMGDQRHYEVKCPGCGHFQELVWKDKDDRGGLKWDTDETTKPNGRYDFDKVVATIRYECEACDYKIKDTQSERKKLSGPGGGRWVVKNHRAPSTARSYHWGKLLPWWASWGKQVTSFLAAKEQLKWGDHMPLKDHINEHRGLPWSDRLRYAADEKFIYARARVYDPRCAFAAEKVGEQSIRVWADGFRERRRFGTIDVQARGGRHFWLGIRAWGELAKSRLLHYTKLWSIDEVRAHLNEWGVEPGNVGIDAATFTSEVYKYVVESGYKWKAMKGDDRPFFLVNDGTGVRKHMIYTISQADPAIGTSLAGQVMPMKLWIWSKPAALDRLALFQHGMAGDWQIYKNSADLHVAGVSEEYALQVTAYERRQRMDPRGVTHTEWHAKREDDHATSVEMMQIICAAATDLLSAPDLPLFQQKIQSN